MKAIKRALVPLFLTYLRFWAKAALFIHKPKIIGIAGSVGKSSTRNAVAIVLSPSIPIRVIETNSETGLPLGILGIKPHDYSLVDWATMALRAPFCLNYIKNSNYLVIEMGIDDPYPPKNMEYLLTIVSPQIGIITYESAAHTMQFAKIVDTSLTDDNKRHEAIVNAITREDLKLLTNPACKVAIVNTDSIPLVRALESLENKPPKVLSFGSSDKATIKTSGYKVTISGTVFQFTIQKSKNITLSFPNCLFPEEYKGTFAASLLAAQELGINPDQAKTALEKNFRPPNGRSSIFRGIAGSIILDSSYNASKPTNLAFLTLLRTLRNDSKRPAVAIIADMLELGPQEKMEHEEVASAIPGSAEYVYLVGPLTKKYILPILKKSKLIKDVQWFDSAGSLNEFIVKQIPPNAIILVKGSQGQLWLEETIKLLLKDKSDTRYLCRQDPFWQKVKKKAKRWIEVN